MIQTQLIEELKNEISSGRAVIILGSGVSIATCQDQVIDGYPVSRWNGLISHGIHQCLDIENVVSAEEANILQSNIDTGKIDFLIFAAELIFQRLQNKSPGVFHRWMKDSLGNLKPKKPKIIQIVSKWPAIISTINYDNLIEKITNRNPVTWKEEDKVQTLLRIVDDQSVLHLHGFYDQPDSIVLGQQSYRDVVNNKHAQAVNHLFTLSHTIIFIGCDGTFQDPNFAGLIEWGKDVLKNSTYRHYILCLKSQKLHFIELQKQAPWLMPIEYGDKYDDLLPFLQKITPSKNKLISQKSHLKSQKDLDLHKYAKALNERYAKLKLESIEMTGCYYRELELWNVFIPQNVREVQEYLPQVFELPKEHLQKLNSKDQIESSEFETDELDELRRRYLEQETKNVLKIIDDKKTHNIVLLGDPGSGKSSLIQAVATRWANDVLSTGKCHELLLFVELKTYSQFKEKGQINDFIEYIKKGLGIPCEFDEAELINHLNSQNCCIFFDGLDEVFNPTLRDHVINSILLFSNTYSLTKIVLTSRVIGYKADKLRGAAFNHYMIQELNDDQISEFLEKWHNFTYSSSEKEKRDENHKRLIQAIKASPSIRELGGNPLLLTMMAILNRYRDLPRDRSDLYGECSKLLLQQWKVDEALEADPILAKDPLAVGFREKRAILRRLAREMQTGSAGSLGNIISGENLESIIHNELMRFDLKNSLSIARALITQLRFRNFILCYVGSDSYAFVHRTFLEFFCADDITHRFEHEKTISIDDLKQNYFEAHWNDETWHEVLCLVAGTIYFEEVENILRYLLTQEDPDNSFQHIFLAARCLGEIRKGSNIDAISDEIWDRISNLINFEFNFYIDYQDTEEIQKLTDIKIRAIRLCSSIWRSQGRTKTWLFNIIQTNVDDRIVNIALEEISRGWTGDHEVKTFLVSLLSRPRWNTSDMALKELERGWFDDPDVKTTIKTYILKNLDSDYSGRRMRMLVKHWKGDPEVLNILKQPSQNKNVTRINTQAFPIILEEWNNEVDLSTIFNDIQFPSSFRSRRSDYSPAAINFFRSKYSIQQMFKCISNPEISEFKKDEFIRILTLAYKNDPNTLPFLINLLSSTDQSSFRITIINQIANVGNEKPDVWDLLTKIIQSNGEYIEKWYAIQGLASNFKNRPGALEFFIEHFNSEKDSYLRYCILFNLIQNFKKNQIFFTFLKKAVNNDPHRFVRLAALEGLVHYWKDVPEVRNLILDHAQKDRSGEVRLGAVKGIMKLPKKDEEIKNVLLDRIKTDKMTEVRESAIKYLVRSWRHDNSNLILLRYLAKKDPNQYIRRAALREISRGWREDPGTKLLIEKISKTDYDGKVIRSATMELNRFCRKNKIK